MVEECSRASGSVLGSRQGNSRQGRGQLVRRQIEERNGVLNGGDVSPMPLFQDTSNRVRQREMEGGVGWEKGFVDRCSFFFSCRGGGQRTGPRQPGGKGIVPVLSDGNINYSGTTIKRTRRWMPIECRKLETRRVERNERWSKMEKSPGMTDEGGRCTRRKKSPRRIQNQILGRAPCHRQEERCRSSGLGGGGEDGWKKGKVSEEERVRE